MRAVEVARVYEHPPADGRYRVLVDRLWPRGVSRASLELDEWATDVAPSTALRRWYGHDPNRVSAFRERYRAELAAEPARSGVLRLVELAATQPLLLLTATRDVDGSGAAVLRDVLLDQLTSTR